MILGKHERMVYLMKNSSQKKRVISAAIALLGVCILVICILLTRNVTDMSQTVKTVTIAGGCIVLVTALIISVILDRGACRFECQKCSYQFKPTITAYLLGAHFPMKRHLKCPKCNRIGYCKVKVNEEVIP